ncbi:MAG TPA: lipocalin-like domain-containing protein [Candidatus Limnocylindria bacterium]|nr:lipocalin-like domain-containing protein [Candidatus Limnocylindria bacterium]
MRRVAWLTLAALVIAAAPRTPDGYRMAVPSYRFEFPRDHASHPAFRTEWWYYTGRLEGRGRRFGYELTFFRVGVNPGRRVSPSAWAPHTVLFAHIALGDEQRRRFRHHETASRPALGMAGADSSRYRVWIHDWSAELAADGRTHRLRARVPELELDLELVPLKPEVVHGDSGISRKSAGLGHASHYYSLTRLETRGTLVLREGAIPVRGTSWMDHEFSSDAMSPTQVGWDWFSLQLDDGRELMLYRLRLRDGGVEPASSGTWIERDGAARHLAREAFDVRATDRWTSPHSGAVYPAGWEVRVPSLGLVLTLEPTMADQELVTGGGAGIVYWEGRVRIAGRDARGAVRGSGFVELTGYAGPPLGL